MGQRPGVRTSVIAIAVFVVCAGTVNCSSSPSDVLSEMGKAASSGDDDVFTSYFTKESRPFVAALLALQKTRYPAVGDSPRPIQLIVESQVLKERIDGDRSVLRVRGAGRESVLVFLKEDGEWRLDVAHTDLENSAE